jgi:type IV pilus assembly protein PilC
MEFKYTAGTADGSLVNGVLEAESEDVAQRMLWDAGLTIVDLKKPLKLPALYDALPSVFGIKRRDVIQFSRNLSSLLDAGIPVMRALAIQGRLGKRPMQVVLKDVVGRVEKGARLSEALAEHSQVFPRFYIYLVKTGEEVGNLSDVLKQVANHMEKEEATANKVKGALAYPAFVLLLAVGAVFVMMAYVVPAITSMFKEFKAELPALTRAVISVSDFLSAYAGWIVLGVFAVAVLTYLYIRTARGRRTKDRVVLKVPLVGQAIHKSVLSRFCRNMSMLVAGGVSLFEALKLTAETTDNTVLAASLAGVRNGVAEGKLLSEAVGADSMFPMLLPEMIKVGEESGTLTEQLSRISNYYEEEADRAMAQLTGMLTPALTLGVGAIIGLIAVTIFSSIYSMVHVIPE